ncbi:MAG: ATP-binding protein [Anaerolineales bacterium]|jgi:PAS domain S-box-containing protein
MSFLSPVFQTLPYLTTPTLYGWLVWALLLGLTGYSLYTFRRYQLKWKGRQWGIFVGLLILTPIAVLLVGFQLASSSALPTPGIPTAQYGATLLPFAGLPWTLAAGLLGPVGAALVGGLTGLLRGLWDTHNLFTMLEMALLAAIFSAAVRQRYRTILYRTLRQPLVAAILLIPLRSFLYVLSAYFFAAGETTARLDYAFSNVSAVTLAFAGEMLVAGLVAQIVSMAFSSVWCGQREAQLSPAERSLEARFLFGSGVFVFLLLVTLLIGDWIVAGRAARNMLEERLRSTAQMASQTVPFFLETGQNLAEQITANPRLLDADDPDLSALLGEHVRSVPYFDQAFVLDSTSTVLGCYPDSACQNFTLFPEEDAGVQFALSDVPSQIYAIPPDETNNAARVSFIIAIKDANGQTQRIFLGRTDLGINPLTQPLIESLSAMSEIGGTGILLDDNGMVLYHPDPTQIQSTYTSQRGDKPLFYDDTASDGTRQMVYYQPVPGRAWSIVLTVPAQETQQLALEIALPLSVMLIILALFALIILRIGLRVVTQSLQRLASEADRITQGQLDRPLQVEGEDEVGQLGRAFEQMRISLQQRLDELNRLLVVSQGVASTLNMEEAFQPVLDAALAGGASVARVVLSPQVLPEAAIETPSWFSAGEPRDRYTHLDDKILAMTEKQERIVLANVTRSRALIADKTVPHPASLMAVALQHKKRYYGVLWVAYDLPRAFSESDVRYISTLAGQAALAAANTHLFLNVEVSRRQLEAILNSTPDPVLVTDPNNRLLLANSAAEQAIGSRLAKSEGQPTQRLIQQKPLLNLLNAMGEKQSVEVLLPDGRTYLATASSVMADGQRVGRVCIMRDVTHFKELDTLKSEFVSTVSHDLRSPLTLMRGYATMLDMVGNLNEQQESYVSKIISGVENMSHLINDLLDLGRIELGVDLQLEKVSVLDVLEKVTNTLQMQATQKDIDLSLELPKDLPDQIDADPALFHQAIYNLVENAVKYTSEGGQVFVRVRTSPQDLLFEIQDTGIGIAPEDMARLFEKFYRGKAREARARAGTGLGLAIVRSIAERHGGRVWVESEEGKGSTFYLLIPIERQQESQAA